nr:GNAT family N-acetyltransferase [Entomohabitans teleogrylli]
MKEKNLQIRAWRESDRPFLRTLYLHTRRHAWTWMDGSRWRLEDFDALIRGERVLVASVSGHRAGFAAIWLPDNFLHSLFVAPQWQGKGIGSALLQAAQDTFTSTGALKCLVKNDAARRFYLRHGWHIASRGDAPQGDYWLMHYPLPPRRRNAPLP